MEGGGIFRDFERFSKIPKDPKKCSEIPKDQLGSLRNLKVNLGYSGFHGTSEDPPTILKKCSLRFQKTDGILKDPNGCSGISKDFFKECKAVQGSSKDF